MTRKPDAWVMVPKEPTEEMLTAAWASRKQSQAHRADLNAYKAMLKAAPVMKQEADK